MPVTVHLSADKLCDVDLEFELVSTSSEFLSQACGPQQSQRHGPIIATSFSDQLDTTIPRSNGLLDTVIRAYNHRHHLSLRPDDVWLTLLSQFSLYVHANAESLRSLFVNHEGQKELVLQTLGSRSTVDFGAMAREMTSLMQDDIADPTLREWLLPSFTTTTDTDTAVASILMMATLKDYFTYTFSLLCGIPLVTLQGDQRDWQELLERVGKLDQFGSETSQWADLLRPVLSMFVRSFDEPDSATVKHFWQRILAVEAEMSGPTFISGWIVAFAYFDKLGKPPTRWQSDCLTTDELGAESPRRLARYHQIDLAAIPPAHAEVAVKLDDNGITTDTIMVAGVLGCRVSGNSRNETDGSRRLDTVEPMTGWAMIEVKESTDESLSERWFCNDASDRCP